MLLHKENLQKTILTINHMHNGEGISVIDIAHKLKTNKATIYNALKVYDLLHPEIWVALKTTKMSIGTLLEFCKLNKANQLMVWDMFGTDEVPTIKAVKRNTAKLLGEPFLENRFNIGFTLSSKHLNRLYNDNVIAINVEGHILKICRCEY